VLEHVEDPKAFLQACVTLLKPGGRLCIGVPNNDSYLGQQRFEDASLNLPPHHATRWGVRSLRALESVFPLSLRRLRCESLLPQHAPEFITVNLDAHWLLRGGLQRRLVGRVGSLALTRLQLRKLVRGHTMYASYTRRPDDSDTVSTVADMYGRPPALGPGARSQTS